MIASALYSQPTGPRCRSRHAVWQASLLQSSALVEGNPTTCRWRSMPIMRRATTLITPYLPAASILIRGNSRLRAGNPAPASGRRKASRSRCGRLMPSAACTMTIIRSDPQRAEGTVRISTPKYQRLAGRLPNGGPSGRGTADLMKQRGENRYPFWKRRLYLPCLPGSDTGVVGSEVIHDREEQVAGIWNARF